MSQRCVGFVKKNEKKYTNTIFSIIVRTTGGKGKVKKAQARTTATITMKREESGEPKKKKKVINSLPSLSLVLLSDLSPLPSSLIAPAGSAGASGSGVRGRKCLRPT